MIRLVVAAAVLSLASVLSAAFPQSTSAAVPPDETFEGVTGGGTITITFTQNRTKVRRIELDNVTYQPAPQDGCGATITVVRHFDPAVSVNGSGSFSATLIPVDSGVLAIDLVSADGQVSGNTITGSTAFSASNGQPEQGCFSDSLSYSATGPIDTPPNSGDILYAGTVEGYAGLIEVHVAFGAGITSLGLDGVTGPCGATSSPIDARDFFDPPVAQGLPLGDFATDLQFSSTNFAELRKVTIAGEQPDPNTLTGTMTVTTFVPICTDSANWTATRVAGVGGVTELASVATEARSRSIWPPVAIGLAALLIVVVAVQFASAQSGRKS